MSISSRTIPPMTDVCSNRSQLIFFSALRETGLSPPKRCPMKLGQTFSCMIIRPIFTVVKGMLVHRKVPSLFVRQDRIPPENRILGMWLTWAHAGRIRNDIL